MNRYRTSDIVHVFCADAEVLFDPAGIIQGSFCVPDSISFLKVCAKESFELSALFKTSIPLWSNRMTPT